MTVGLVTGKLNLRDMVSIQLMIEADKHTLISHHTAGDSIIGLRSVKACLTFVFLPVHQFHSGYVAGEGESS